MEPVPVPVVKDRLGIVHNFHVYDPRSRRWWSFVNHGGGAEWVPKLADVAWAHATFDDALVAAMSARRVCVVRTRAEAEALESLNTPNRENEELV